MESEDSHGLDLHAHEPSAPRKREGQGFSALNTRRPSPGRKKTRVDAHSGFQTTSTTIPPPPPQTLQSDAGLGWRRMPLVYAPIGKQQAADAHDAGLGCAGLPLIDAPIVKQQAADAHDAGLGRAGCPSVDAPIMKQCALMLVASAVPDAPRRRPNRETAGR